MPLLHCLGKSMVRIILSSCQQVIVHYLHITYCCREEGNATILIEDATDPGWGPPPQEGATLFQATFNMVRRASATEC